MVSIRATIHFGNESMQLIKDELMDELFQETVLLTEDQYPEI